MAAQEAKYQKVIDWVKENIENGTFRPGDRLESENEMSERFGISRQTIRHATGVLAAMDLVTRVRGSGTYIKEPETDASAGTREGVPGTAAGDPGRHAEGAARVPTMNIGVVSTFYESYIFPSTLKGIERVLSKNGYTMQVSFTDNRLYREEAILRTILEKNTLDGLIVEPAKSALPNPNIRYYRELQERGVPLIFFNSYYQELDAPCVRLDDVGVARKAVSLLIRAGHTRIGGIFKCDDAQGQRRYQGYLEAMLTSGCRPGQDQVLWIDTPEMMDMKVIGDYLFHRMRDCSAVLCYNDQVAFQVVEMATERGIRVPEDLSVVGIDDAYLASVSKVPLTSFPHPKEKLGRKTAENLLKMIEDPSFDGNCLFDSEPVIRESIANLPVPREKAVL